jgi:D-alanyl-lipoteichoic acid acyltransferase DltB (MBOAT superfamily)
MLICGVWHGAAFTYVVFGCIQGLAVALTHWVQETWQEARGARVAKLIGIAAVTSIAVDFASVRAAQAFGLGSLGILFHTVIGGSWLVLLLLVALDKLLGERATLPMRVVGVIANFTFVGLTFAMFRANSLAKVGALYERLLTFTWYTPNLHYSVIAIIVGAVMLQWLPRSWSERLREKFIHAPSPVQALALITIAFALREAATMDAVPFVYFQF